MDQAIGGSPLNPVSTAVAKVAVIPSLTKLKEMPKRSRYSVRGGQVHEESFPFPLNVEDTLFAAG